MDQIRVIGARIRQLRENQHLEVGQLAYKTSVSPSYLYKLEAGESPNASGVILARVARALNTTVEYLIGVTNDPRPMSAPSIEAEMDPAHLLRLQELAERVARLPGPRQRAVMEAFLALLATEEELEEPQQ